VADGGAAVDPHPDRGDARYAVELADDPQAEPDPVTGVGAAQHDPVAQRLHLLGTELGQDRSDAAMELERDLGGAVVALEIGERGEAD
jgi:hypothetical protein